MIKIYLLTAVGLTLCGSTTHIYTQTMNTQNNKINDLIRKSAGSAPSLRVIPWRLSYN